MVEVQAKPWMQAAGDEVTPGAELPPFRPGQDPEEVYDELAARLIERPTYPRRVLAAANLARLATSDDPADDLLAHRVLAEDPAWAGRVVPIFSPDRYLDPGLRGWRTDSDLLAEVTGVDTETLDGFLLALRARRSYFLERGAVASEHHCSDVAVARMNGREAAKLYQLARSGELLPAEAVALESHLLWETGRMTADDGLAMAVYPPAGFRSRAAGPVQAPDDRGIADRLRPLLADFGTAARFSLLLFTIDSEAYATEIVPLAARNQALTSVPPTRFADDPTGLRAVRVAAVEAVGARRSLGIVDDMSGPFALARRHRLGRRLDAGALAELVVAGRLSADQAYADLTDAVTQAPTQT
jgi:glucuronate isomerase